MDEREGFLKVLAENPDNVTTRLVFADWLDDHGEHEEAERQRKWVAAKEWLVKLCHDNNPPSEEQDEYGSFVSYEKLIGLAESAIRIGFDNDLWHECRNNNKLCKAIRENEEAFYQNVALVTGAAYRLPRSESGDPCGHCPWG